MLLRALRRLAAGSEAARRAPQGQATPDAPAAPSPGSGPHFRAAPGRLADGRRVYAIGDVHGHAARLRTLHAMIAEDLARRPMADSLLVQLGDLIDRGPDVAGAIEASMTPGCPVGRAVTLLGNHEAALLAAITGEDPAAPGWWLAQGGEASLRSWGVSPRAAPADWARLIPAAHLAFLRAMPAWLQRDGYGFVHAGVRPGRRLGRQRREDLLWMREPFLGSSAQFGVVVVHGHTPVAEPCLRPNRIGIDTGVTAGGPLTCAVLEGDRVAFLTA